MLDYMFWHVKWNTELWKKKNNSHHKPAQSAERSPFSYQLSRMKIPSESSTVHTYMQHIGHMHMYTAHTPFSHTPKWLGKERRRLQETPVPHKTRQPPVNVHSHSKGTGPHAFRGVVSLLELTKFNKIFTAGNTD